MVRFYCRGNVDQFTVLTTLFGYWRDKHIQTDVVALAWGEA